jgi:copper chaperone
MINLKVKGMTCGHCEAAVRKALAGVAGVTKVVDVSRERGEAQVEGEADANALLTAVRAQGYEAEIAGRN